jgi:Protein of unknown function (DUF3429)
MSLARGMSALVWLRRGTPLLAYALGLAGALPVVAMSTALVAIPSEVRVPKLCLALLGYGAVTLSFIGAVHWGIALASPRSTEASRRLARWRLMLGVLPALAGWASLLIGILTPPFVGLLVLMVGFAMTGAVEAYATRRNALPPGYMSMRWLLTVIVEACLLAAALSRMV